MTSGARAARTRIALAHRRLSGFPPVEGWAALMSAESDAILLRDAPPGLSPARRPVPAFDTPAGTRYCLALRDALLLPAAAIIDTGRRGDDGALPGLGFTRQQPARLLLASDGALIADSFERYRVLSSGVDEDRSVTVRGSIDSIAGPALFVDAVSRHFGHALIETTGRLWPLVEEGGPRPEELTFVGVRSHGLGLDPRDWPRWLLDLFEALGIDALRQVRVAAGPVRCERLLVPENVSPYLGACDPAFERLMRSAGARLAGRAPSVRRPARVFLSRSAQPEGKRSIEDAGDGALDGLFASAGFAVVQPERLPLSEQAAIVRSAEQIAGCIGSQMHLLAFCETPPPNVLRIAPDFFDQPTDALILRAKGGTLERMTIPQATVRADVAPNRRPWRIDAAHLAALAVRLQPGLAGSPEPPDPRAPPVA